MSNSSSSSVATSTNYVVAGWTLVCAFLVVFMQLGFAMLEVGSVREAHRMTVLVKNITGFAVCCLFFGAGSAAVPSNLVTNSQGTVEYHLLFFHWAICAVAVSICSGAMAERTQMLTYLVFSAIMSSIIFPVLAVSVWSDGGLLQTEMHSKFHRGYDYHDFSGGGIVHFVGGISALIGNALQGRRIIRPMPKEGVAKAAEEAEQFAGDRLEHHAEGDPGAFNGGSYQEPGGIEGMINSPWGFVRRFDSSIVDSQEFSACCSYLQVMGMFALWVGWYGLSFGMSLCSLSGQRHGTPNFSSQDLGSIAWKLSLAACAGGTGAWLHLYIARSNLDAGFICNGVLAGLVAISSGVDVANEWISLALGFVVGLAIYPLSSAFIKKLRIDDPVDGIAVHGCCGLLGVLLTAFFPGFCNVVEGASNGCQSGHSITYQLLAQVWGAFTVLWWTAATTTLIWGSCALSESVRSLEAEQLAAADEMLSSLIQRKFEESSADEGRPSLDAWQRIMNLSPVARRVIRQLGYAPDGLPDGTIENLQALRSALQTALGWQAQTALEGTTCLSTALVRLLGASMLVRELAVVRLRISPAAELSGLGPSASGSGQVLTVLKSAMKLLEELRRDEQSMHLRQELRDLSLAVRSQDQLIVALANRSRQGSRMRGLRSFGWHRRLQQVPEVESKAILSASDESSESSPEEVYSESRHKSRNAAPTGPQPEPLGGGDCSTPRDRRVTPATVIGRTLPAEALTSSTLRTAAAPRSPRGTPAVAWPQGSPAYFDAYLGAAGASQSSRGAPRAIQELDLERPALNIHSMMQATARSEASTVSDQSAGLLSQHSGEETPPTSYMPRQHIVRPPFHGPGNADVQLVASRLTALMSALGAASAAAAAPASHGAAFGAASAGHLLGANVASFGSAVSGAEFLEALQQLAGSTEQSRQSTGSLPEANRTGTASPASTVRFHGEFSNATVVSDPAPDGFPDAGI